ncbi:hypothetical protein [Photobacterium leiognathi]|nr:hypothetical protein [Photobacterium leiognathi]
MKNNDNLANILRSQEPFDESLHSFLLRTMWKYDPTITPIGVIQKSGGFLSNPFCHKSIEHLFKLYPDHILLEKIDINTRIKGINNSLFYFPTHYSEIIKHIFFPNRKKAAPRQEYKIIRYCLNCINKSIKSFGYGYLRNYWDIDDKCLIHNSTLKAIPLTNMENTIINIKLIMKGIEPEDAYEVNIQQRKYENLAYPDKNLTEKYLFPIKFADCIMLNFSIWIINNIDKFKSNNLKDIAFKLGVNYIFCKDRYNIYNDLLFKKKSCISIFYAR